MARSNYKSAYVDHGYEGAWRAFWVSGEITDEVKAANAAGHLGRVEFVVAGKLEEAIAKVRHLHPGCTIMREGSSRIGAA